MISDEVLASVLEAVHSEAQEDYVGFWKIPWLLRRACPAESDIAITEFSLWILHELADRKIFFGDFSDETGDFIRWSDLTVLADVDRSWRGLGRDPNIGDFGYFVMFDELNDEA